MKPEQDLSPAVPERQLRFCNRVASVFLSTPDDDVYARVLDIVGEAAASPDGLFSYLDEDGAAVMTTLIRGKGDDCRAVNETTRFPRAAWGDNLWTRAILRQQSLYTNSPGHVPADHLPIRRALTVPILYRGAAIGHFALANKPTDYGAEDVALVEGIAAYIAPILHARLEQERHDARRKRAEAELAAMSRLPAESPGPVLRIGADGVIQYANAASAPLLALWQRQAGESVPADWRDWIAAALAASKSREIEITAGGRDFACLLSPVSTGDYVNVYGHDVTERWLAEKRLRQSQALLAQAQRIAGVGAWEWDRARDEFTFSEECARLLGTKDRLTRAEIAKLAHPVDLPAARQAFADALAGTRAFDIEQRVVRPDTGEVRCVHLCGEVVRDQSGEPIRMYGAVQDITERKQSEVALRESEERFRATFEQAAVGIAHVTPDGRCLRANQRFADIVGYSPNELLKRTIQQLTYPDDLPAEVSLAQRLLAGEIDTFSKEKRYVRKNGALVWANLTASLARDAQNRCEYVIGVVQDITARKEAEQARDEAEQRFTRIFENVDAVAIILSSEGCITCCNPYLLKLTGWSHNEILGRNWSEVFLPAEERERVDRAFLTSIRGGEFPFHIENKILTRDGQTRLISWSNTALHDAAGHVIGLAALGYDITDHRRADEAVRRERTKLRRILEAMPDAVCIVDTGYRITYVNPAFVRQFGDGEGRHCHELFHDRAAPCAGCKMPAVFAGRSQTWELQEEGTGHTYEVFDTPLQDQDGKPLTLEILHDITARKQAQLGLARRTRELETLADNAPDVIVRLNRQLQYVFVNRRWSELMGVTPDAALGKTSRELGLPDVLCRHAEEVYPAVFADRQMRTVEFSLPAAAGVRTLQLRMVPELGDDGGEPQTILIIARDTTEQTRLQEELNQAQKLELVGRLAAGIAHDINNVLLAVSGYAALARRELAPGHPALENLAALERTVIEASAIPKGLLTFTHRAPSDRAPVDLRAVLDDAERLLKRLLPASIDLVCEAPATQPLWILGDATQMRQVILNLAINARDAMPEGGHLWIGLEAIAGKADPPTRKRVAAARLTISDSGIGMAAEVVSRVFEPFFTTKPRGSGTGLGLAIVKSIVESLGGQIELSSTPGTGTDVVIRLPCVRRPRAPREPELRAAGARGRGEWILIADDNAQVLEILAASLRQMGYEPQQAANAPSALAQCAQHADRIRLLILDYDLPGGSGLDVLRKVRRAKAALPAILISGELGRDLDDARDEHTRVIRKPFRLEDLTELVTELLTQSEKTEATA